MRYLVLLYADPELRPAPGSPEQAAEHPKWMNLTKRMLDADVHRGGDALHHTDTATTVRVRDGKVLTTDGPFAETKETLGGFYLIDVDDLDAAIEWATQVPNVDYGSVEIRPVMEFADAPAG